MNRLALLDVAFAQIAASDDPERHLLYQHETDLKPGGDDINWAAAFVNWVLRQAGYTGSKSPAARRFLYWGTAPEKPLPGCVIVLKSGEKAWQGHVGFYLGLDDQGNVLCLGGHASGRVCVSTHAAGSVLGYRVAHQ